MTNSSPLREISAAAFASLGMPDIAYIKPVVVDGVAGYAVHAANGNPLGLLGDRAAAQVAVRENDMEPVSVH